MGSTVGIPDMSTNGGGLDVPLGEFCIISNCSCSLLQYALGGLWGYGELESLGLYLLESLDTPLLDSREFPTAVTPGTPEEPLVKLKLVLDDSAIYYNYSLEPFPASSARRLVVPTHY